MEKKGKIMSKTSVSYLENNEAVALSVIEITSIPNLSIIDNNAEAVSYTHLRAHET